MAQHYAISEALVVAAGLYAALKFVKNGNAIMAIVVSLFSLAALVGTIKFAFGLGRELDSLHNLLSQFGGLAAMALILSQILALIRINLNWWQSFAFATLCVVCALLFPAFAKFVFLGIVLISFGIILFQSSKAKNNFARALAFGLMLPNFLLIRGSATLGPDIAFHAFHIVIAIWVLLLDFSLSQKVKLSSTNAPI